MGQTDLSEVGLTIADDVSTDKTADTEVVLMDIITQTPPGGNETPPESPLKELERSLSVQLSALWRPVLDKVAAAARHEREGELTTTWTEKIYENIRRRADHADRNNVNCSRFIQVMKGGWELDDCF